MNMITRTLVGDSAANTAKTHTITQPTGNKGTKDIEIRSLTVSTAGADIAADTTISIQDNAVEIWRVELRSGKVFGGHFRFDDYPLTIRDGDCTIVTDAAGASVIVSVSVVYNVV